MSATLSAQAKIYPARDFGLTPETGYLNAVTPDETCNPKTDVMIHNDSNFKYISKCDSSIIGWVEIVANGRALEVDQNQSFGLVTGTRGSDQPGGINIYTCRHGRDDELAGDTRYVASRDAEGNYRLLREAMRQGLNFKIQLFYNQYLYSGKCIGAIEVYKTQPNP